MISHEDIQAFESEDEKGKSLIYCPVQKKIYKIHESGETESVNLDSSKKEVLAFYYLLESEGDKITDGEISEKLKVSRSTVVRYFDRKIQPLLKTISFNPLLVEADQGSKGGRQWKGYITSIEHQAHLFPDERDQGEFRDSSKEENRFDSDKEESPKAEVVDAVSKLQSNFQESSQHRNARLTKLLGVSFSLLAILLAVSLMIYNQIAPIEDTQNKSAATERMTKISLQYDVIVSGSLGTRPGKLGMAIASGEQINLNFSLSETCWLGIFSVDRESIHPIHSEEIKPQLFAKNVNYSIDYTLDDTIGLEMIVFVFSYSEFILEPDKGSILVDELKGAGAKGAYWGNCKRIRILYPNSHCFYFKHISH